MIENILSFSDGLLAKAWGPWAGFAFACCAVLLGLVLLFKTHAAIAVQIKFYRLINWEVTPISMKREVRSTRIMGGFVLVIGIISLFFAVFT